jgi:hypothetical protein
MFFQIDMAQGTNPDQASVSLKQAFSTIGLEN